MKPICDDGVDRLIERVCNTVGDGHSLSEQTISELLDAIKTLKEDRRQAAMRERRQIASMRAQFAAHALQGLLASDRTFATHGAVAASAVSYAHAIIAELSK